MGKILIQEHVNFILVYCIKLKLRHRILVCETGVVIQPSLFWLAASPDGLVVYQKSDKKAIITRVKVPSHKETHVSYWVCSRSKLLCKLRKS